MTDQFEKVEAVCAGNSSFDLSMYVDGYPDENSKGETDMLVEAGGGPAGNAAYLLGKWGIKAAIAGVVGSDHYGERIRAEFKDCGVNTEMLKSFADLVTPVSFIVVNRCTGSRTVINRRSVRASKVHDMDSIPRGWDPGLLLFDGHELEISLSLMQAFPHAVTVLDAGSLREGTDVLSRKVDFLVCSERFGVQMCGLKLPLDESLINEAMDRLRSVCQKTTIMTLGERGVVFDDGKSRGRAPAMKVSTVDTTAAGDIFHGAFAYSLLRGFDIRRALEFSTAAAGLSVARYGGRPSIPALDEVNGCLAGTE